MYAVSSVLTCLLVTDSELVHVIFFQFANDKKVVVVYLVRFGCPLTSYLWTSSFQLFGLILYLGDSEKLPF